MVEGFAPEVALATKTTFNVGGPATYFAKATSVAQLQLLLANACTAEQPVTILGGGSNVLVADSGISGCVISPAITDWEVREDGDEILLTAGAGVVFDEVVAHTVAAGWWGLENLSHIPGWVGATPIQNVGAYGVEVGTLIDSVRAVSKYTGATCDFTRADCQFGYRHSWFKTPAGREWVITHVTYRLSRTPRPQLRYRDLADRFADYVPTLPEIREAIIAIRAGKFPDWHRIGTAGSFFMNPIISIAHYQALQEQYPNIPSYPAADARVKVPLGWVLDKVCGLRGYYDGPVGCYEKQALVLVQTGGASTREILNFADRIAAHVYEKTNITITKEVTVLQ